MLRRFGSCSVTLLQPARMSACPTRIAAGSLGTLDTLGGGNTQPRVTLRIVLGDRVAVCVRNPEVVLRQGIPLLSGQPEPLVSLVIVLRDTVLR
jgi:hypothetical protein